ncbi:Sulfate transporter [Zostera marina]|uniref:Sulfate transporter n=1 Tax=Zostera marina TaxID=29655 RepID=A0A0K9PTS5_ZOSMR|nr:Sulfate transporter [Zostera marina]
MDISPNNHHTVDTSANPTSKSILLGKLKSNLSFRSKWSELNGAMGDLGTYIPIVMALSLSNDINLGTTLIFNGAYNFITGIIYGVPMPVQPMKSIAAVAISSDSHHFGQPEIMAAGILTSGVVFVLGVTGLMRYVYRFIPLPVVRGIQLAQGLSFAITAVKYVKNEQDLAKNKSMGDRSWLGLDGLLLAIVAACFIVVVNGAGEECHDDRQDSPTRTTRKKFPTWETVRLLPSAIIVFILGLILAVIRNPSFTKGFTFGPSTIHIIKISKHSWKEGFFKGAIPQLPLSILNSVIAVCRLSSDLFPDKTDVSATSVSVTVGLMNLVGCWFGAMPCCHGAGGLAGQYKFGGRSGACVALLGVAKLGVGLVFGSSLLRLFMSFPVGLLGVLLLFAGIELAMASRDMGSKEESFVMLVSTAVSLVKSSAALGFVSGILVHLLLSLRKLTMV